MRHFRKAPVLRDRAGSRRGSSTSAPHRRLPASRQRLVGNRVTEQVFRGRPAPAKQTRSPKLKAAGTAPAQVPDPKSIVRIVAFHNSIGEAVAYRSDGVIEPIELEANTLQPGEHEFEYQFGSQHHYRGPAGFLFRRPDDYQWAAHVRVIVLPASSRTQQLQQLRELPAYLQEALYADERSRGTYEEAQAAIEAGEFLLEERVTEEELIASDPSGSEARTDPVVWALGVIERRQQKAQDKLTNLGESLRIDASLLNLSSHAETKLDALIEQALGHEMLAVPALMRIDELLAESGLSRRELMAVFERALVDVANDVLAQTEAAVRAADRLELDTLIERLDQIGHARDRVRASERALREASREASARFNKIPVPTNELDENRALAEAARVGVPIESFQRKVEEARAEYDDVTSRLLPIAQLEGFDLDELLKARTVRHLHSLVRGFTVNLRRHVKTARRKIDEDVGTLYAADRIVDVAKRAAGIKEGSLVERLIRVGTTAVAADRSFWQQLLEVLSALLPFLPGRIGVAVGLALDFAYAPGVFDDFATGEALARTGLSSKSPSIGGSLLSSLAKTGGAKAFGKLLGRVASAVGTRLNTRSIGRGQGSRTSARSSREGKKERRSRAPATRASRRERKQSSGNDARSRTRRSAETQKKRAPDRTKRSSVKTTSNHRKDPLVAARVQGGGSTRKGTYFVEGTPEFERAAKRGEFVIIPKSWADAWFRPAGTPHSTAIKPLRIGGQIVESEGAGRGLKHNIVGRAPTPKTRAGAKDIFDKTIGAARREDYGHKHLIQMGEMVILRPGNVSTQGVDSITVSLAGGRARIYLNDFTGTSTSKGKKEAHHRWLEQLTREKEAGHIRFADRNDRDPIYEAIARAPVFIRIIRVDISSGGVSVNIVKTTPIKARKRPKR
jgi:hypothetical protein